jgi:ribA/ribD-fused uncharacterized protein
MMIASFMGSHRFLSNFHTYPVVYNTQVYKSSEHAYQAAKALSQEDHDWVQRALTPNSAKKRGSKNGEDGRKIVCRPDWEEVKLDIMLEILRAKFSCPELAALLLATDPHQLVEGNYWGDTFWGVCNGTGENHLGRLLMIVREELKTAGVCA